MMSKEIYQISVHGCDDTTTFEAALTPDEFEVVKTVCEKCTATSTYGCQPTMSIEKITVYRCGWCGHPCDKDGNTIPWPEDKRGYDEAEKVHGYCCIHEQSQPEKHQVTRDMAIDAGDPSLEGQWGQ